MDEVELGDEALTMSCYKVPDNGLVQSELSSLFDPPLDRVDSLI